MTDVDNLTGRLLVGVPHEQVECDPGDIFERSVVLILHHDDDGAQGVVLTCPIDAGVDDVLPGWQEHVSHPDRLFQGGPVGLDSAIGLAGLPGGEETLGVKRIFGHTCVVDLDAPPVLVRPHLSGLRVFAGHSGWESGQLEDEIAAGAWWVVEAEAGDPYVAEPERLWGDVVRRQGPPICHALTFPADVSLN